MRFFNIGKPDKEVDDELGTDMIKQKVISEDSLIRVQETLNCIIDSKRSSARWNNILDSYSYNQGASEIQKACEYLNGVGDTMTNRDKIDEITDFLTEIDVVLSAICSVHFDYQEDNE